MKRPILDGIELVIARNDPLLSAAHVELEDRGQEMPGVDQLVQFAVVERDRRGGIAATVDHAWNTAFTAHAPGGPFACPLARRGRQGFCSGHSGVLEIAMLTVSCADASSGAGRDATGAYNGAPARMQCLRTSACLRQHYRIMRASRRPRRSGVARSGGCGRNHQGADMQKWFFAFTPSPAC